MNAPAKSGKEQYFGKRINLPSLSAADYGDRLHICVGFSCNNNCIFCMEDNREDRYHRLKAQTAEDVKKMLLTNRTITNIMFTSGEPTLHPYLPTYISWARSMGFSTVGLVTNGRMFTYREYAKNLLKKGLNHILVSIHGHNAKLHDSLTRTKGSFEQTFSGMKNLRDLKSEFRFKVHTATVLNRKNLKYLREFFDVMAPLNIDQHIFNVIMPQGRGSSFFRQLMPRYSKAAAVFGDFVSSLPEEGAKKVFLLDIPYCTTENLPDHVRGSVERYFHYEPDGTTEMVQEPEGLPLSPVSNEELLLRSSLAGDTVSYSRVEKSYHDLIIREKREECKGCKYDPFCKGVWKQYLDNFRWTEFTPVKAFKQ